MSLAIFTEGIAAKADMSFLPRSDSSPLLSSAVACHFTVPMKSASGLKVNSLEVVNEVGYRPFKGVRSLLRGDLDWRW